jgi:tetrahydromethanopterin S-methyltransferase subunit G
MSEDRTQHLPDGDMKQVLTLLSSINERLTALEDKVDRRLQETRPIWEQVLSRLTDIEKRLEKVESEVYSFSRKLRVYYDDLIKMQDTQEDFDERLRRLESGPSQ